ncbi:helix-turn-helix domain-containing protein [Mycolicibacterium bacteremicum]|uniref:helix-turn-helix domain-containing protein n=1 Tax=Mycolicibacterium bacteremicum TaxID=564198 RepID=UPI0026EBE5B5|nr:helix-turn-helix transcriptional regulator [Mycolicibacterium bacteremicum]
MVGKEPEVGFTAKTVAKNVTSRRVELNMNYKQLSERMQAVANWSINAVGIRRIESHERRVTPDDLIALALALGVSPVTLLMPATDEPTDEVEVTGSDEPVPAYAAWSWLIGETSLEFRSGDSQHLGSIFQRQARPKWVPLSGVGRVRAIEGTDMAHLDSIAQKAAAEAVRKELDRVENINSLFKDGTLAVPPEDSNGDD